LPNFDTLLSRINDNAHYSEPDCRGGKGETMYEMVFYLLHSPRDKVYEASRQTDTMKPSFWILH